MRNKLFICILVVCLIVSTCGITVFADGSGTDSANYIESESFDEALAKALYFADKALGDNLYENILGLYDFNNVCRFLYVDFGENGYVIVDFESLLIVEAGMSRNSYITNNQKIYYTGPLSYFVKDGEEFVELYPVLTEQSSSSINTIQNCAIGAEVLPLAETDYAVTIRGTVPNYSYNPTGICGSTAAAMWLMYMDENYNDNYVAQNLESANGVSLILAIESYIDGYSPGSTGEALQNGLQQYLYDRSITLTIRRSGYSSTIVKNQVSSNKPFMVAVSGHPTYANHWVTAYGYYIERSPNIAYLIVNDGHGGRGMYINPSYIDYLVY